MGEAGGKLLPKIFSFPPKPFAIIKCPILKCAILSKILVECYMKTAKNGQCVMHASTLLPQTEISR